MSLNYNIIDTIKLLGQALKYNMFIAIIVSSILFTILLIINKDKKIINYIIIFINLILIVLIGYYYIDNIISFKFRGLINNMYFYFFNCILYLIIMIIINFKSKYKVINYIFYGLSLINIMFSLFITYYLNNVDLIVIGNIFPMIKFGNIIYMNYYLLFIILKVGDLIDRKKK